MRGVDSCDKCVHNPICEASAATRNFYFNTRPIGRVLKNGGGILTKAFELLADNCKHYNDKGGDKSGK